MLSYSYYLHILAEIILYTRTLLEISEITMEKESHPVNFDLNVILGSFEVMYYCS